MSKHRIHNCPRCGSMLRVPIPMVAMVSEGVDGDNKCPHCKLAIEWRQELVAHEKGEDDRSKWEPYYG